MDNQTDDPRHGWNEHNRFYKERADDPEWLLREALRRAVDIRDEGIGKGTMLVSVLNLLSDALGYETYRELWLGWDS